jgi:Uma2 family endonuclease
MTIAFAPAKDGPLDRLLTAADLAALPSDLPSGSVRYELDAGRLIIMPPPRDVNGSVEAKFTATFIYEGDRRGLGKTRCGEVGIVLWRDPDRVVGADVVFIANRSLPIRESPEGYLETIPDLVVEVLSKSDKQPRVLKKVEDYLIAGVHLVGVADPSRRAVTAYRRGQEPAVLTEDDRLTIGEIIPGLELPVREVFQE